MAQPRVDRGRVVSLPRLQSRDRAPGLGLVDQLEGRPGQLGVAQDLAARRPGEEAGRLLVSATSVIPPPHRVGMPDDHEDADEAPQHDLRGPRLARTRGGRGGQQDRHGEGAAHDHTLRSARSPIPDQVRRPIRIALSSWICGHPGARGDRQQDVRSPALVPAYPGPLPRPTRSQDSEEPRRSGAPGTTCRPSEANLREPQGRRVSVRDRAPGSPGGPSGPGRPRS